MSSKNSSFKVKSSQQMTTPIYRMLVSPSYGFCVLVMTWTCLSLTILHGLKTMISLAYIYIKTPPLLLEVGFVFVLP